MEVQVSIVRKKKKLRYVGVTDKGVENAFEEWEKTPGIVKRSVCLDGRLGVYIKHNEIYGPQKLIMRIAVELENEPLGRGETSEGVKAAFEKLDFEVITDEEEILAYLNQL